MITLGIDPGLTGAFALYDPKPVLLGAPGTNPVPAADPLLLVWDMPTIEKEVSGKPRRVIDRGGLCVLIDTLVSSFTIDRIVVEEVGGMPGQSAPAAFAFGYGAGLLHMALHYRGLQFDTVRPGAWKKVVKAPADKKLAVQRADEIFPWARDRFRRPPAKGKQNETLLHDRAEAALLAYWAAGGVA